jgi:hypothetical protein
MEQRPSWEANSFSASQEIPRILCKPEVQHRINNSSCPEIEGLNIYVRSIVKYIDVRGASCPGIRGVKYLYTVYCELY